MGSDTWLHLPAVARRAAWLLAGGLLVRRTAEVMAARRCARWSRSRLSSVPAHAGPALGSAGLHRTDVPRAGNRGGGGGFLELGSWSHASR